jgi:glycosyltransferase involved in cell wall biosynthesis
VHAHTSDARARSLNIGKRNARGRYLAFLDDDDKVYPNHFKKLIESLQKTDLAWAYADIIRALYNEYGQLVSRSAPFRRDAYSFLDHLRGNFIPIHSFVIDLERASDVGEVDETMSRNEDYEYILRLSFKHEPLCVPGFGAEYCIRSDGTNTVSDGTSSARHSIKKRKLWNAAQDVLDEKKMLNFGWWIREIDQLPMVYPLQPRQGAETYTSHAADIRHSSGVYTNMLREYYASTSWRLTRPLRSLARRVKGLPPEQIMIPDTEAAAQSAVDQILRSTSWKLTAPVRLLKRAVARTRPN